MLLGTLSASLLGNMITDKGMNRSGEGIIRASYGCKGSSEEPVIKDLWFE